MNTSICEDNHIPEIHTLIFQSVQRLIRSTVIKLRDLSKLKHFTDTSKI